MFPRIPIITNEKLYIIEEDLENILKFYKSYSFHKFNIFVDLVVIDIPKKNNRFILKYLFLSLLQKRLEVSLEANELSSIKSITHIFPGAN
jgi:NADH:ubiquinone oxidoreductase subunit C